MGLEIRLRGTALPCVAQRDIQAGRAVKIVPAANAPKVLGGDSSPDPRMQDGIYNVVQGATYPSSDNDVDARFVAAFRVFNEKPPFYTGVPTQNSGTTVPYVLRDFADGSNLPADFGVSMVAPRLREDGTIPSGSLMLAYDVGIYTVTSGCFFADTYNVGDPIGVKTNGIWYNDNTAQAGVVWESNTTKNTLTIKLQ